MFVLHITLLLGFVNLITGLPHDRSHTSEELEPRIVGGEDAPEGFAPHMVALLIGNVDVFVMMSCGGSMVSTWHILTAAHCVYGVLTWDVWNEPPKLASTLRGVIGSNKHTSTENIITFTNYINHPEWDQFTWRNDVGILVTSQEIRMKDNFAIIPLETSRVDGGVECYVTGWGSIGNFEIPKKLQLLHVTTLSHQECEEALSVPSLGLGPLPLLDPDVEICTFHSPGHGMCNGDSGSAVVSTETGRQVGIVAWGIPCAVGFPDVSVRISGVMDFVQPILDNHIKVT